MSTLHISIIILSYKSKAHLGVLLPSVFESVGVSFVGPRHGVAEDVETKGHATTNPYTAEVIVVDNDSRDGTIDWLSATGYPLIAIANINNGFSAGNNIGIQKSRGKYVLLLNPDTKLETDTLKTILDFMESRPDVGISGCRLIKGDGSLDLACRRRFPNPWNAFSRLFLKNNQNYNYTDIPETQEMEVDSVVGAFLLIRRSVMEKIGLLDEAFFMYGEDLDWCWRCKAAGYKVWYYPKVICHHYKGESSRQVPFRALKWFHDAMWVFYKKHYAANYFFLFNGVVWIGIYGRLAALVIRNALSSQKLVSK